MLKRKSMLMPMIAVILMLAIGISPASAQGTPKRGGSFKIISIGGDVRSLGWGPEIRLYYQIIYSQPVCETLIKWDEKGQPAPLLASGWKISNDLKSMTFTLRKGVKFHDGTDFDAEAVKFNLEAFQKSGRADFEMVSSIDVVDKHTIRLNFKNFSNMILTNLTMASGFISSPTAVKKMGVEEFGRNPVGTGPFKFKSWKRDLSIKFERFDGYWQKGKPYVDEFEWVLINDQMTAVSSFMAGEADVLHGAPLQQTVEWKKSGQYEIRTPRIASISLVGDSGNPDSPFAKLKVRQAISHAIDSKAIVDSVMQGFAEVTNQYSSAKTPFYNNDVVGYPYDPQKAKKLLAEAGYQKGFKTNIWWLNVGGYPAIGAVLQDYLKEVGIDAEVKLLELTGWMDKIRGGWDGLMYIGSGNAIPDDYRGAMFLSNSKMRLWKSPECPKELEDLLAKGMATPDLNAKVAIFREYNKLMVDKYCLVNWIMIESLFGALQKRVRDSGLYEVSYLHFNPADVYLNK